MQKIAKLTWPQAAVGAVGRPGLSPLLSPGRPNASRTSCTTHLKQDIQMARTTPRTRDPRVAAPGKPPSAPGPRFPDDRCRSVRAWAAARGDCQRQLQAHSYAPLALGRARRLAVMPSESQHTGARLQISPLAGSLLLALASLPRPAAFRVLFVSLGAALALLLIDTHGPSAVAGKLTGIIALLTAAAAGYVLLATASRASAASSTRSDGPASDRQPAATPWPSREAAVRKAAHEAGSIPARAFHKRTPDTRQPEPEKDNQMPKIIIQANQSDGDADRVTLSERIVATHLQDDHYAAQLIQRLTWAATDAERLESPNNGEHADEHDPVPQPTRSRGDTVSSHRRTRALANEPRG